MIGSILDIVNKFIPDKDSQAKLAVEMQDKMNEVTKLQADIIKQEMNTKAGNWRPTFMKLCMLMIVSHWLLYDIAHWFIVAFEINVFIPQSPDIGPVWDIIKLGLGGYIGGRSVEKVTALWKK